jgi:hypothetical protein
MSAAPEPTRLKSVWVAGLCVLGIVGVALAAAAAGPITNNSQSASARQITRAKTTGSTVVLAASVTSNRVESGNKNNNIFAGSSGQAGGLSVQGTAAASSTGSPSPSNPPNQADPSQPTPPAPVIPDLGPYPIYPIDPMPCKFPKNFDQTNHDCIYCADNIYNCGGCQYGNLGLMCANPY